MSAPSSDGRPSFSSEPSAASSRTFHSKTSRTLVDGGEGASTHSTRAPTTAASQRSGSSPVGAEAIDEHDFAHRRHRAGRAGGGGFLLDATLPAAPRPRHRPHDAKGKGSGQPDAAHTRLRVPKTRASMPPAPPAAHSSDAPNAPPRPAVDPNQLVHMALSLSESRRRNISASQLLGPQSRAPSAAQRKSSFSNAGPGSSLRQYLNEQRRMSRNISPMGGKGSPSRHMSTSMQRSGSLAFPASQSDPPTVPTLLRRDKARAYIELRAEYMRLLEFLPPLKEDANAPGNFIYTSNAVPGSPQAQLTRTPSYANKQHELGRPYNPLQALRNRRSRARERLTLPHEPASFADIDQVHEWVDQIEAQSRTPAYRREDGVSLPRLHADHDHDMQGEQTKPSKAQQGWSFTPEELLADAYWLELGDNKTVIEDRNGRKIFPPREPPKPKHDFLQPRPSKEYSDKRRRSWVDGVSGTVTDPTTGDESEHGSERGRKRRLLTTIRTDSRLRKGRGSPRKHSTGYSDSSDSDSDTRRIRASFDSQHNTGPLALQLKKQLELKTKGINAKSPAIFTPDTPDKWGRSIDDVPDGKVSRNSLDDPRVVNGFAGADENTVLKMPPRNRINPLSPIKSAEARSSLEDDSTAPSTPLHTRHFPHIGSDLSPPPSRAGSDHGKTKRSKLNIFHSSHDHEDKHASKHESKHEQKQEQKHESKHQSEAGSTKKHRSRQTSEEPQESSRGNAILAAPGAVKNLLGHRKNESVSSLQSPDKLRRKETQDFKEPHSVVTRFFKGVKHEGTKVGDIIFRRDRADETDASTLSDRNSVDFDDDKTRNGRPTLSRTVTSTTAESVSSDKEGRYHLKLPSFRPAHEAMSDNDDASDLEHHISRQSRERRNSRSPRIDRLLPPRMDLERVPTASSTATLGPVHSRDEDHVHKQLARPGGVFPRALPPTALKDAQGRHRSVSRPNIDGKRHWSIADDNDEHALQRKKRQNVVTQADIARVRALFLCSGIKAKEITRRAQTPNPQPPPFLTLAAQTASENLIPISRKQEHILAARMLVHSLERSTTALHLACEHVRTGALHDAHTRITQLRTRIESHLLPRIVESADSAVRISSDLAAQGPLHVKHINDEIDSVLRRRRRHVRWVMGWGWSAVEWGIVVALRCASLVFAVYGVLKSAVGILWAMLRWLVWL